jgi:hypothetical protein
LQGPGGKKMPRLCMIRQETVAKLCRRGGAADFPAYFGAESAVLITALARAKSICPA